MMMKPLLSSFAALAIGMAVAVPSASALEVRVNVGAGPSHSVNTHAWPAYAKAVDAASNGEIKFKMFVGGALLNLQSTLQGLRNGVADAGFLVMTYWPAELAHQKLLGELALLGTDGATMVGAISEFTMLHCADCQREFTQNKVVLASMFSTGVYVPWTRDKVTTMEEIKGKKIRSGGPLWNRWSTAFGAIPASVPGDDMYDSLSRGMLDASIVSIASGKNYNMWDVTKHLTMLPLGTFHSGSPASFGADFWKDIKPAERKILLENAVHAAAGATIGYYQNDLEVLKLAASKGMAIHQPDPTFVAASEEFARKDLIVVAQEAEKYGIKNPKEKIDMVVKLIEKWGPIAKPADYQHDKLVDVLRREIYAKLDPAKYGF